MKLFPHQVKYARDYKDKELVVHEGGTGKSICACVWLKDGRDKDALVVCPKRVVQKWKDTLEQWGADACVLSKEDFTKTAPRKYTALVIDEADEFASPLFVKGRSKRAEHLFELTRTYDMPTLLLTATPIRSTPWNLHTLLCYLGIYIPYKKWQAYFFRLEKRPYLPRPAWLPVKDWQSKIVPTLRKYSDIVLLKDCVGVLPPVTETVQDVPAEPFESTEWEGIKAFVEEHRHEQRHKAKHIIEAGKEYRKVVVVAHYVEQCEQLEKELSKDRPTYMIHGGIADQEKIITEANASEECYFIIQASLGAGFDCDTFSAIIFASLSYKVRDLVQMKYRVRRIHNLHPVAHHYLIGGRCDKAVYDTIQRGRTFVPSEWDARTPTGIKQKRS